MPDLIPDTKNEVYPYIENLFLTFFRFASSLRLEKHKSTHDLKIIACGGDGTLGWYLYFSMLLFFVVLNFGLIFFCCIFARILSEMNTVAFDYPPAVAILPLGTGNDLSNILGWGTSYSNEPMIKFFDKIQKSKVVLLDR